MKLSPAAAASLMALFTASASAAPSTRSEENQVNLYQASGMAEMKDGSYALSYDNSGTPKIIYTPPSEAAATLRNSNMTSSPGRLSERAEGCDNFQLNEADTDAANADLQSACGDGYYGTIWSKSGDTVAFYCQYASEPRCRAVESRNANHWITEKCGWYWAGSYESNGRTYAYGYTDPARHNFCGIWLEQ
ncbi:hypothetical protein PG994_002291 [Apiospora phragmitis]|uniref:Uncharacterized protein n=1 Tax=Apiospora phragmitis TaxID=2905665 RepID=A0ABR1WW49_9PEZI